MFALAVLLLAADPPDWPTDALTLANGAVFRGLVVDQTPAGVTFRTVVRQPGRPTVTLTSFFAAKEVAFVKRMSAADRAILVDKLADLDPGGRAEQDRMAMLDLEPAAWLGRPNAAKKYTSERFTLLSAAPEELTRRAAVRLEQIYAAFANTLPPTAAGRPTEVILADAPADYATLAGRTLNPAVYDPAANRIVCGSDLRRLGADLLATRIRHTQQLAAVAQYETDVRQLYKDHKAELERHLATAAGQRRRIALADRANDKAFDAATARLFALLYHEAFHSYATTFAYPPLPAEQVRAGRGTGELPRWLNEGLAQVFETAVLEAGELRVGHPDRDRLGRVQALLKADGLVPVAELLTAGKERYLAAHASDTATADRVYLSAWAVTYWLAFEKRLVGGDGLATFLREVNGAGDPSAAFAAWTGLTPTAADAAAKAYFTTLTPAGKP